MGFGDVKLAPTLGLVLGWYGWGAVVTGTFAGFALGAVWGLFLIAARRAGRRTALPFGPFMLVGALAAVLMAAWRDRVPEDPGRAPGAARVQPAAPGARGRVPRAPVGCVSPCC